MEIANTVAKKNPMKYNMVLTWEYRNKNKYCNRNVEFDANLNL